MTSGSKKRGFGLLLLAAAMFIIVSFMTFERSTLSYRSERSGYLFERVKQAFKLLRFPGETNQQDDDEEAQQLAKQVRVLCWVMTAPQNLDTKAQHVKNTWGKRCNILLFISSVTNDSFPTIGINSVEGHKHLTAKTMFAFRYIFEHYFDLADWFLKADDDTYVIVENLRYFLSGENPDDPVYFGRHFVNFMVNQGYTSGGGGYVISKEALRRFGKNHGYWCNHVGGAEDVHFGACMQSIGVRVGNSSDALGRSRFHCFKLESHLKGDDYPKWFYKYDSHNARHGPSSISNYAISFHYVSPDSMYVLDFLIYHIRPYGIYHRRQQLNVPQNEKNNNKRRKKPRFGLGVSSI